jgi:hypothetical protein
MNTKKNEQKRIMVSSAKDTTGLRIFSLLLALGLAILALLLSYYLSSNLDTTQHNAETRETQIEQQSNTTQSQIMDVQISMTEAFMDAANMTLLQQGNFTWAMSVGSGGGPYMPCFHSVPNSYTMVSAGTGYRVNDLVTVNLKGVNYEFTRQAVFRIMEVAPVTGAVVDLIVLNPGCFYYQTGTPTMDTLSIVGSGLQVSILSGALSVFALNTAQFKSFYGGYAYPAPPVTAPLQEANYSLYTTTYQSATVYVLHLYPPPVPMVTQQVTLSYSGTTLHGVLNNFEPRLDILRILSRSAIARYPLSIANQDSVSVVDDANCFETALDCHLQPTLIASYARNSVLFSSGYQYQSDNTQFTEWIEFFLRSDSGSFDYIANHANFTLVKPWIFILPAA